jgi:sialate O-acetylesterase
MIVGMMVAGLLALQGAEKMPRADVIEVPAIAEGLCVSNLFQSNMVMQRGKPASIWGWAAPGEKVTVTFAGASQEATAGKDRAWKVTLPQMEASAEPRTLTVKGAKESLTLDNILVGDVWVLGGQSNMEFPLTNIENGNLEIVSANFPEIRLLTIPAEASPGKKASFPRLHQWSDWSGRHFRKGDWDVCSPETVAEMSAIGFVFARRIHKAANVPIGVIDTSRGGTTVETWTPDSVLRKIGTPQVKELLAAWDEKVAAWDPKEDLKQRVEKWRQQAESMKKKGQEMPANKPEPTDIRPGPPMDANRPGNCYAGMIGPLEGLAVKGAIFHQGFNNCFSGSEGAKMYYQVFPPMIAAWRAAFGEAEMPFGILSLCTDGAVQTLDNYTEMMSNPGPYIREAQYKTFLDLYNAGDKNIGFTSTYDLRRRWYHPQLKIPAGERIARWALATQYGMEKMIRWKPPIVKDVLAEGGHIQIGFDEAVSAVDDGSPIYGFAIAGEDRNFHPAEATFLVIGKDDKGKPRTDSKSLVLTSPMVPDPVHYRYAWGRSPLANLQASRMTDIPIGTQRSDDWDIEEIPLGILPEGTEPAKADRRKIQEALRKEDLRRHLKEARDLIEANQ